MPRQGYASVTLNEPDIKFINKVRAEWKREHGIDISLPEIISIAMRFYAQRRGFIHENDTTTKTKV